MKEMVQVDTVAETNKICKEKDWSWVEETLDEMEDEMKSCRKDAKNLRSKYESFCLTLKENLKGYGKLNITHHYTLEIEKLCRFVETPKTKSDKEDCLKLIKAGKENVKMMSEIVTEEDWDIACTKMSSVLCSLKSYVHVNRHYMPSFATLDLEYTHTHTPRCRELRPQYSSSPTKSLGQTLSVRWSSPLRYRPRMFSNIRGDLSK